MVYNIINPTQTYCVTCGMSLKHANPKSCPNPNKTEVYLRQNTGFDGKIHDADKVCYTCYRSHLVILQESSSISKDVTIPTFHMSNTQPKSVEEVIDRAMIRVTIAVGKELLG